MKEAPVFPAEAKLKVGYAAIWPEIISQGECEAQVLFVIGNSS